MLDSDVTIYKTCEEVCSGVTRKLKENDSNKEWRVGKKTEPKILNALQQCSAHMYNETWACGY